MFSVRATDLRLMRASLAKETEPWFGYLKGEGVPSRIDFLLKS